MKQTILRSNQIDKVNKVIKRKRSTIEQISKELGKALAELVYNAIGRPCKQHVLNEYIRVIHPVVVALGKNLDEKCEATSLLVEENEELHEEVDYIQEASVDIKIEDAMTIDKLEKKIKKLKARIKKLNKK